MTKNYTKKMFGKVEASILELYLSGRQHYLSEICRKTRLARPSVLRTLKKFEKLKILKIKNIGNIKLYTLNKNKHSISLISLLEYEKTENFLNKNPKIKTAVELFIEKERPIIAIIFGSYSKGKAIKGSDLDLLLVKDFKKNNIKKLEELSGLAYGRTGINISPVLMKLDDMRKRNVFVKEIIEAHYIIKGAELFYEELL